MTRNPDALIRTAEARARRNIRMRQVLAGILFALGLPVIVMTSMQVADFQSRTLTMGSGDLLGQRHVIAKALQDEAKDKRITLNIKPVTGRGETLDALSSGDLDIAFVAGTGEEVNQPNVSHVAALSVELVQFFVRSDIESVDGIRGRTVNMGAWGSVDQVVGRRILEQAGLAAGKDYTETNHGIGELYKLQSDGLPDVVVHVSHVPSKLGEFLARERGYGLLEVPFPAALATRLGWVSGRSIPGYTFSIAPPVPQADVPAVGVKLHLVANSGVDTDSLTDLLEMLYGPELSSRLGMNFDEKSIADPSGYSLSEATLRFIERNEPLLTGDDMDDIQKIFGLIAGGISMILMAVRWLKGGDELEEERFRIYMEEAADIEREIQELAGHAAVRDDFRPLERRLAALKEHALRTYATASPEEGKAIHQLLTSIADSRTYLAAILRGMERQAVS